MAKTIKIEVSAKDAKTIMAAAEILKGAFTPATEPVVAVIEEAPAKPTKKAAVKKDATAKAAKKETKKAKKTTLKKVTVHTLHRITLPRTYLDATGAFGGQVDVLRKYGREGSVYFIPAGASYNTKKYGRVKTVTFDRCGQVAIGRLLKGVEQGDEVKVDLVGDKIIVRK